MKFIHLLFYFSLISISLPAQQSNIDLCDVFRFSKKNKNVDTISYLLQLDSTQVTDFEKAEMFTMRGVLLLSFNKSTVEKKSKKVDPILMDSYRDFSLAIHQIKDENDKLTYIFRRFNTLENYEPHYKDYKSDLEVLTSKGYRIDKTGMAITALSKYDGEFWLGAEFSLLSGYQAPFTIKDRNQNVIKKNQLAIAASAMTIGYTQNLESSMSDINFSLLRLEAPLYIEITQFGFIDTSQSSYWYYRPEIGIGYSIFQLSVGYTFFFKSGITEDLSRAKITLRAKHVF